MGSLTEINLHLSVFLCSTLITHCARHFCIASTWSLDISPHTRVRLRAKVFYNSMDGDWRFLLHLICALPHTASPAFIRRHWMGTKSNRTWYIRLAHRVINRESICWGGGAFPPGVCTIQFIQHHLIVVIDTVNKHWNGKQTYERCVGKESETVNSLDEHWARARAFAHLRFRFSVDHSNGFMRTSVTANWKQIS